MCWVMQEFGQDQKLGTQMFNKGTCKTVVMEGIQDVR